jgi:trehalose-phosphatase
MSQPLLEAAAKLEQMVQCAPHLLLCLDFDGTLVPLAGHPDDVELSPRVRITLRELSANDKISVAVISGRNRGDLQQRVGLSNLYYVGNHGLEISGPGVLFVEPAAVSCSDWIKALSAKLEARLKPMAGAFVENKGLTLTVHYRLAPAEKHQKVRQIVQEVLANTSHGFVLRAGHKAHEIRPPVSWNKGSAVSWILKQLPVPDPLVVYLGDDDTDEDAFAVLSEAITVRIGSAAETAAHYCLGDPSEVHAFLSWLTKQLSCSRSRG